MASNALLRDAQVREAGEDKVVIVQGR